MTNRIYTENKKMNQMIDAVASWMYCEGIKNTNYGTWNFNFDDIIEGLGEALNITKSDLIIYFDYIVEELESYYGIAEVDAILRSDNEGYFDITYYTGYCGLV